LIRKAKAVRRGTGRAGSGSLSTDSGVLAKTPYSFRTRFENEKGTNPEELIAAAHAGCFTMALAFQLKGAGYTLTPMAADAERNCPVSKVLNVAIALDARFIRVTS
jgi:lipoyl-dependent peroxiredoxin